MRRAITTNEALEIIDPPKPAVTRCRDQPPGGQASSFCKNETVQSRGLLEGEPYEFVPFLHPRMFCQNLKSYRSTVGGVSDKPAQNLPVNEAIAGDDMVNVLPDPI